MNPYVFMTDSDSDLPFRYVDELDMTMVYMPYILDGKEYFDDLGRSGRQKEYFDNMRAGAAPVTSLLPTAAYIEYFEPCFKDGKDIRFVGVEPQACPTLTRGVYAYDYGDLAGMTPLLKQYTLGSSYIPSAIHAGGLRYHGMSQVISRLYHDGLMEAVSAPQTKVFEAAKTFAVQEGLLPAPESSHAIYQAMQEALRCKETGEEKVILFCLSGHGNFDMAAYDAYNSGQIVDAVISDEELAAGINNLPKIER